MNHNKDAIVLDEPLAALNGSAHRPGGDIDSTCVPQPGDKPAPASPTPHAAIPTETALAASASVMLHRKSNSSTSFSAQAQTQTETQTGRAACACPCPGSEPKEDEDETDGDGNTEASPATATTNHSHTHAQHGPAARSGAEILAPKPTHTHHKAATLPLAEGEPAETLLMLRPGRTPRSTTGLVDARVSTMSAPPIPLRRVPVVFPDTHSNNNPPTTMATTAVSAMNPPPVPEPVPRARSTSGSLRPLTSARRWSPPSPSPPSPLGTAVITGCSYFDPRQRDRDVFITDPTGYDDVLMTPTEDSDAEMDSPNTVGIDTRRLNLLPIHTPPPVLRRASLSLPLPLPRTPDAHDQPSTSSPSTPPPMIGTGLGFGRGLGLHGGSPTVAETGLHCPSNSDSPGPASGQLERRPGGAAKNGGRIIRLDSFGGAGLERKPSGRA